MATFQALHFLRFEAVYRSKCSHAFYLFHSSSGLFLSDERRKCIKLLTIAKKNLTKQKLYMFPGICLWRPFILYTKCAHATFVYGRTWFRSESNSLFFWREIHKLGRRLLWNTETDRQGVLIKHRWQNKQFTVKIVNITA